MTRSLLLVHAHPDDECIGTGGAMARYADEGVAVTLVTCTGGEEGEVLVPELRHLASDTDDDLAPTRKVELRNACDVLGVADQRYLGGWLRWRDSGMMGTPQNDDPRAFWQADLDEAAAQLLEVIRETRPQVAITYDANGAYGHPDHIQAHRVLHRAVELAAAEGVAPAKVYHTAIPKSFIQAGIDHFKEVGGDSGFMEGVDDADDAPMGIPDSEVTTELDVAAQFERKMQALREHRTQVQVDGFFFALADGIGVRSFGVEHYVLALGERGPVGDDGREHDLFAGLA